jgi:hypothetical protein
MTDEPDRVGFVTEMCVTFLAALKVANARPCDVGSIGTLLLEYALVNSSMGTQEATKLLLEELREFITNSVEHQQATILDTEIVDKLKQWGIETTRPPVN